MSNTHGSDENEHLREVLQRFRTVVGIIADQAELEPAQCVVTVNAVTRAGGSRPLAKVSLADCFVEVDELLQVRRP